MSKFWSPIVKELDPYVPGEQPKIGNLIKLNTNENPYGPSPRVLEAMHGQAADSLRLYPDPDALQLKEAIAEYNQVKVANVFVGNGSDEVLAHSFQTFFQGTKPLLFPDITYSFYPVYSALYRVRSKTIPLQEGFKLNPDNYIQDNGGILFANPNAPTGRYLDLDKIAFILSRNPGSVIAVDEAYIDFGGRSAVELVHKYDNLLVIQTLSKSRSLAGLRVGFAIGNEELIEGLERVKNSFNSYPLDAFAIYGGAAAIRDTEYFDVTRKKIMASRERLVEGLGQYGFAVVPSLANFVFAQNKNLAAESIYHALRKHNILVRYFKKPRIDNHIRITVGTDEECDKLLLAIAEILTFG